MNDKLAVNFVDVTKPKERTPILSRRSKLICYLDRQLANVHNFKYRIASPWCSILARPHRGDLPVDHLPSSPSPSIRAGIWRCATPTAPRQLPSLPPPNRAFQTPGANSLLDKI
jgi:hypothetical protein